VKTASVQENREKSALKLAVFLFAMGRGERGEAFLGRKENREKVNKFLVLDYT